ncbi:MAG: EpsG family protein [candidate division WOR-3 bacterium]|nr:EpsG family protein [candidate division WOR-3 bacterium]
MLIYFAVLLVATLAVHLAGRTRNKLESFLMYAIAFVSLVLIGGLRSRFVGTDSGYNVLHFERTEELADVWRGGVEPGVILLSWLGKLIYDDYVVLFTLVAVVVTLCFLQGIRKLSINPTVSIFVLLTSGIFYFSFNGLRQGIAVAILFLALAAFYQRKFWIFLACIAAACFFHYSAIVFFPMYFLVPRKNNLRYNVVLLTLVVLAVAAFSAGIQAVGQLQPRYVGYGEALAGGRKGLVYSAFLCSLGVFFLYFRRHVRQHRPLYDSLLNVFLLGLVVVVVAAIKGTSPSGVLRLNVYFNVSQILLWPIVSVNLQGNRHRALFRTAFVGLYLVYYGMTLQAFSNLVPYTFNPLVQNWFSTLF